MSIAAPVRENDEATAEDRRRMKNGEVIAGTLRSFNPTRLNAKLLRLSKDISGSINEEDIDARLKLSKADKLIEVQGKFWTRRGKPESHPYGWDYPR